MRNQNFAVFALLAALLSPLTLSAGDVTGSWSGELNLGRQKLRIVFHVAHDTEKGYSATMDSPDQFAKGIPVTSVEFRNDTLVLKIAGAGITYDGVLKDKDTLDGTFRQSGLAFPLVLTRGEDEIVRRPQEPVPPFPYLSEEVSFAGGDDGTVLSGTLTMPECGGILPAVILIAGSGAQNRNEEILDHKPFLVIADYLTKNGFAVLRYDKRGVGGSTGDYSAATTEDFAADAACAVDFLKKHSRIDGARIGFIGHSEGAGVAFKAAARRGDIAFIVSMAGMGVPGDSLLRVQNETILRLSGAMSEKDLGEYLSVYGYVLDAAKKYDRNYMRDNTGELTSKTIAELGLNDNITPMRDAVHKMIAAFSGNWFHYFIRYDPRDDLKHVGCPALVLNGDRDTQVEAASNTATISGCLADNGNSSVTVKIYSGLNHLFQKCETGVPAEYARIEETISPQVLSDIAGWLNGIINDI